MTRRSLASEYGGVLLTSVGSLVTIAIGEPRFASARASARRACSRGDVGVTAGLVAGTAMIGIGREIDAVPQTIVRSDPTASTRAACRRSTGSTSRRSTGSTSRRSTGSTGRRSTGSTGRRSTGSTSRRSTGSTSRRSTGSTSRRSTRAAGLSSARSARLRASRSARLSSARSARASRSGTVAGAPAHSICGARLGSYLRPRTSTRLLVSGSACGRFRDAASRKVCEVSQKKPTKNLEAQRHGKYPLEAGVAIARSPQLLADYATPMTIGVKMETNPTAMPIGRPSLTAGPWWNPRTRTTSNSLKEPMSFSVSP
jgi:hypothetical protein